jgi:hypothetical protein
VPASNPPNRSQSAKRTRRGRRIAAALAGGVLAEAVLIRLGQTYGSTRQDQGMRLLGDDIVPLPQVVTNHAITIDAPLECVWPWLVKMGWHRAGWYTARWVDKLLFPLKAQREPDRPRTATHRGRRLHSRRPARDQVRAHRRGAGAGSGMALHSTSHLPMSWRDRASLDWSWAFILLPQGNGRRTRFLFRSRWVTAPWWFTFGGWLGIVPADFVMARDMLNGVKQRSKALAQQRSISR